MSKKNDNHQEKSTEFVRIDKWLWAVRFFKTRQLASAAIKTNKIQLNGQRTKPAASIKLGDELTIRRGHIDQTILVDTLTQNRSSATIAKTIYHETEESIERREKIKFELANQPQLITDHKKPDKRKVRISRAMKRGE